MQITQFSIFSKLFFLITRKMAVLILFTSQNTNITAQLQKVVNEIKFPYNFEKKKCYNFSLRSQNPEVAISKDYHGNRVGNFNILAAHSELIVETNMLVRTTHSQKIPEIDHVKVADLATKLNNDIYLLRLSYPEKLKSR
jgi:hypothetical protein